MNLTRRFVVTGLPLLGACAANKDLFVKGADPLRARTLGAIGLLPSVVLSEVPGLLEGEEPFYDGLFVGNVQHLGGVVLSDDDSGALPSRSKEFRLSAAESYLSQGKAWLDQTLAGVLEARKVAFVRLPDVGAAGVPAPTRTRRRGSDENDGSDNVNLPRFDLAPGGWSPDLSLGAVPAVLVSYLVVYYTHNGGWFIGQRWGCGAGARIRVFTVLYDATTGVALTWRDSEARSIDKYEASPNQAELEDLLMAAESAVARDLLDNLLR